MGESLYIIQNDPEVPPGTLAEFLTTPYSLCHPYRGEALPDAGMVSALIVLGGAMGANDDNRHPFLRELKLLINSIVSAGIPYLGICLGGQLLAAAVGGSVISNRWREIGTHTVTVTAEGAADPLFIGFPETFSVFQWHYDSFDIPAGGCLLASSSGCHHQAFRYGTNAWGIQFHPEVTEQIVREWCSWTPDTACRSDQFISCFTAAADEIKSGAGLLLHNFLTVAHNPVTAYTSLSPPDTRHRSPDTPLHPS